MKKRSLIIAIGAFAFFAMMPGKSTRAQSVHDSMTITWERTMFDNNIRKQFVEAKDNQGRNFRMVIENDVITAFFVNEKKVPIENIAEYKPVVKKIDDQLNLQHQMQLQSKKARDVQDSVMYAAEAEKQKRLIGDLERSKREREIKDSVMYAAELKESKQRELEQENIVNDLIRDTIIKDRAGLSSFWLGSGSFIVNGENLSFEIYDRYKSKYIKTPDEVYSFNVPMRKN
jgi:hypothetical protein